MQPKAALQHLADKDESMPAGLEELYLGRASASTLGEGASARTAEGRASASTIGKGASARSAQGGHLPAQSHQEQMQDVQSSKDESMWHHAAGSRGSLSFTRTGLLQETSAFWASVRDGSSLMCCIMGLYAFMQPRPQSQPISQVQSMIRFYH